MRNKMFLKGGMVFTVVDTGGDYASVATTASSIFINSNASTASVKIPSDRLRPWNRGDRPSCPFRAVNGP